MSMEKLERLNFNTFDPDAFDPDMFDGPAGIGAKVVQSQTATFSITMQNTSASLSLTAELFNKNNSAVYTKNANYVNGGFTYDPVGAIGSTAEVFGTAGKIGFDAQGRLRVNGANDAAGNLLVSCNEVSYRTLFEASGSNPMVIRKMRMTFDNIAQIPNEVVHFEKTFLGAEKLNKVSPSQFIKPDQFQSLIVDIPVTLPIDSERGIRYILGAGRTVQIVFFVEVYAKTAF